ncbi:hypothetical protein BJY14_000770 [Actinomadura luteofluorescens]|uniref:Uncharacterized protein n=1 Tax=Actinomadura luteofluorescens TaxID=46163 RepID=A0A7Y9EBU9_9ACTN|nr:hypothetical protein [Actinomadura luteofluorescens]NYD44787.1 hypothetical protein [Actinomadura luteofluorescens]
MPEHPPHLPADGGPPDFSVLADGLIRQAFTVSMDLHQDLARLSPHDGDDHPPRRQRDGRPGRPAAAAPAHRQVTPAEAERLRRTLRQAIGTLDEIIHGIRAAALAHAIAQAPPAPSTTTFAPDGRLGAARHRRWTAERPH